MTPKVPSNVELDRLIINADASGRATVGLLIAACVDTGQRLAKIESLSKSLANTEFRAFGQLLDSILYD